MARVYHDIVRRAVHLHGALASDAFLPLQKLPIQELGIQDWRFLPEELSAR
jgi:hypothetical protein